MLPNTELPELAKKWYKTQRCHSTRFLYRFELSETPEHTAVALALGFKVPSLLLWVVVYLSSVFSCHFSQMAPAETGKLGLNSLHNLSRLKPSSYAALQDRGQQPFPLKTLTQELSVTSCTTELTQGAIHPFSAWKDLNLQLLLPIKCHHLQTLK